jgi:heme-degrading monooxygenase HmoA
MDMPRLQIAWSNWRRQCRGFGVESARDERGISVSFWKDEASIENWKQQAEHLTAQQRGKQQWYSHYELHVARVERYHSHSPDKS